MQYIKGTTRIPNSSISQAAKHPKCLVSCWLGDFDKILWSHRNDKSLIWIYSWTRWATSWQLVQFRQVGRWQSNRTRVDGSGLLTTMTADLTRFGLETDLHLKWWSGTIANTTYGVRSRYHNIQAGHEVPGECTTHTTSRVELSVNVAEELGEGWETHHRVGKRNGILESGEHRPQWREQIWVVQGSAWHDNRRHSQ